jgi:hypothetical protein
LIDAEAGTSALRRWSRAAALYVVAVVAATWPYALYFRSRLPSLNDPLQHLWIMRWYRTCLMEGRSPLVCNEIQYPMGAPLGNFSPLHIQGVLFVGLRFFINNDILVYNLIWIFGFLLTGLGTYELARRVVGGEPAALLAGLLAMLSGPMLVHSHCHLELIFVGGFPLFLLAWMRFVDEPSIRGLVLAIAGFALISMSAAYFLVFTTIVGLIYVGYRGTQAIQSRDIHWLLRRIPWLCVFGVASLLVTLLLFAPHIWATMNGRSLGRSKLEFDSFHLPWWTYFTPVPGNRLATYLPFDPYAAAKISGEGMGYLGIVTIVLLAAAAFRGAVIVGSRYWWLLLAVLAILSLGSYLPYDGRPIELPASWMWEWYPPIRLIRVPARFKFFVAVVAAVLAASTYARLDRRLCTWPRRSAVFALLAAVSVFDLAHTNYPSSAVPPVPSGYAWLLERDPKAVWVDAPQASSGGPDIVNAMCTYWQSYHRGRTTAGYSGQAQWPLDNRLSWASPFSADGLSKPEFLSNASAARFDLITEANAADYMWAYLTVHRLTHVVLHRWIGPEYPGFERLRVILEPAKIYEDDLIAIYERDLLPPPTEPVVLCAEGWETRIMPPADGYVRPMTEVAWLMVYNPSPARPIVLGMRARGFGHARRVVISHEHETKAEWVVPRESQTLLVSPAFNLPMGFSELNIRADGAVARGRGGHTIDYVAQPISLLVSGVNLRSSDPAMVADQPETAREVTR